MLVDNKLYANLSSKCKRYVVCTSSSSSVYLCARLVRDIYCETAVKTAYMVCGEPG